MRVTIFDHYGLDDEPKVFDGTPMQIEQQLRAHFKGTLGHIPFGNLYEMLNTLERMTGLECEITGERPAKPRSPEDTREILRENDNPWMHELDAEAHNRNL